MKRYLLLVPCLLLLAAALLSACGGGGDSDESKIEAAIEASATSADPSNCTELQTQRFDQQNAAVDGAAAIEACEKESRDEDQAESVAISNVSVDGDSASAEVALSGGALDGQAVEIDLVEDGDQWKLDEIVRFTRFDAKALGQAFEEGFEGTEEGVPAQITSCLVETFSSASQSEAEELIFAGSQKPLENAVVGCR